MERPNGEAFTHLELSDGSPQARDLPAQHNQELERESPPVEGARSFAIASTFTADPLRHPLNFWMETLQISAGIAMAPYGQVMQELLSPQSLFSQNKNGFNILLIRLEDWIRDRLDESVDQNLEHIHRVAGDFITAVEVLQGRTTASMLIFFGPSSASLPVTFARAFAESQSHLKARLGGLSRVHCWTHDDLIRLYPVVEHEDARADRIAHIPYTNEYFVAMATLLARRITVLLKPQHKVIAIDCDNTLWKGICGEDGAAGVELTPAHLEFQKMLVRQHDAGILLCLCSKNNPSDVDAVFTNRPEMPLRDEHLICSRVNWNSKSSNLQSLAQELGLSLDSFMLVDDSPLECAEVRTHCPSVLTLQFPETPERIAHFVNHVWAFDRVGVTEEAKQRTAQYRENRARSTALEETGDLEKFLASLELKVEMSLMQPGQLVRVAELVQRTNQFNLTAIRRSLSDIEALWNSGDIQILVVHVRDRFGDYGLVGALFLRREPSSIEAETFVLSCRVLGRGVEHRIVTELGRIARQEGLPDVVLRYRKTPRNVPAWGFLKESFSQFKAPSKSNGESATEVVFTIPLEYAEALNIESSVGKVADERVESIVSANTAQSMSSNQWHETALRLSSLSDIILEINRSVTRGPRERDECVAPRTLMEASVAEVWADVLGVEELGIRDDFFGLGGDSLMAVQVIARIGSVLGLELSLYEFFDGPTIESIATKLGSASQYGASIERMDRVRSVPLSSAQQRLWFIDQLEGGSAAYHIAQTVWLKGELDRPALQAALDTLVKRHESLRTVFIEVEGEPVQKIAPEARFALHEVDLSSRGTEERKAMVLRQSKEELAAPFDLNAGPLIRGRLFHLSEAEHVLLITMHHMVSDGWSIGVLIRELGALYEAYREGQPDPLPPLPIQYADYAQWQRQWLTGAKLQEQLRYWKEHLQGAPELLELPTDRPRPAVQSYRGASVDVSLGSDLAADLKTLSRRLNLTLAMILYTAWSIVLSRLSGQEDIVVGMPVANRRRTELEGLIGFFVNTLAVRVRLEDDPQVTDLLLRVKETMLEAYAHQDVPFERVVEALQPARSLGHSPVFQVMFVLQNAPRSALQLPGLMLLEQQVPLDTAQFDLLLSLQESADGIFGIANYASDLFEGAKIERWVGYFKTVLSEMVRESELTVSRLSLMIEDERRQVIDLFNATQVAYPGEKLVHELFEEQVDRAPEAVAVVCGDQQLTYEQLNRRANQLAHALLARGVRPDERVGLCVERSVEMVVGLLGILKAGGAYVPLDGSYPAERLRYMLRDSTPVVLVTQERLKETLSTSDVPLIALDANMDEVGGEPDCNLDAAQLGLRPQHLASIIYTSGSTGMPKGVMVEHAGLCNLAYMQMHALDVKPHSRVLQFASLSFDACTWECVMALCSGARLCVASREDLAPGEPLLQFLRAQKITHATLPPVALSALPSGDDLQLSTLIVAGEACPIALAQQWASGRRFINAYGPTEATVCASMQQYELHHTETIPIGRPIANAQIYILDRYGAPVPIGVTGEIHIGGAGVARGYLGQPELTAQRFITNPFSTDQSRLYKTGDLGRWRADGTIEFLGRNDHQVKIRGFRIELGEIEMQLARHEQVKEATVVAREDVPGEKRLVAYVTQRDQSRPSVDALRKHLKGVLPEYMVPSAFVILESLPLTPSGKLDRRALPAPEFGAYASSQYEPPQGEVEEGLARIWQELLQVERVGRQDNFFELGGHSLLAVKSLFKINQSFGCPLRVTDVYRSPTMRDLAIRIGGSTTADEFVDLSLEATLDEKIVAKPGLRCVPAENVMLTGGTGFVGRFLLVQLLQDTDATLYCLVRAQSEHHAFSRLRTTLSKWNLWRSEFERRIVAIPGDLGLPRCGIDEVTYQALSQNIDSIYHCATSMNHLESYAMAKPTNVEAARELLKLATHNKPKLINYISSLSVFSSAIIGKKRVVDEQSPIDHEKHSTSSGYVASKWVGEKIFMTASERGIPCNIFRVGLVWADTHQGRYDELQHGYRVLKSCLLSGYGIKNYRYEMAPTPVDYAARAMVFLANRHSDGQGIFHISSSSQMIEGVFERCNEIADTSLELMPFYDWICEIKRLHHEGWSLPVVPLVEFAFCLDEKSFREHQRGVRSATNMHFDCIRTHRELERAGIVAPVLGDDLLRTCVESMLSSDAELRELLDCENRLMFSRRDGRLRVGSLSGSST
jgi:amino acid adenylation domain-containing protein/FkbH-like protein/thioester reductase-like protein